MKHAVKFIAATPVTSERLVNALTEHSVAHHCDGKMVVIDDIADSALEDRPEPARLVALLRDSLSSSDREEVSVVEDLAYPHEFPVTTRLEAWWSVFETSWFDRAVAANAFTVWFQPVVDTTARRTIGHECLLRLTKGHRREGAEIMAAAAFHRDLAAFDACTRRLAAGAVSSQAGRTSGHDDSLFFVNFIASTIGEPVSCLRGTIEAISESGLSRQRFILEAVGSNRHPDIPHLRRIGNHLKEQGTGFALDDVGYNADAVRLICDIRPDYIKLERRILQRLGHSQDFGALRRLVDVAERLGVHVIAKGVERVSTMERLLEAGVNCMQGYLFGSPTPEITRLAPESAHNVRETPVAPQFGRPELLVPVF